jgi:uncharacterized protein with ParB-like and HNH nuclease domain
MTVRRMNEVLGMLEDGQFRLPYFQRPFVWSTEQTKPFLESLFLGLPTGPILVFRGPADAETVSLGPVRIDAPAVPDAFWIVDGGQRLTVLAAVFRSRRRCVSPTTSRRRKS